VAPGSSTRSQPLHELKRRHHLPSRFGDLSLSFTCPAVVHRTRLSDRAGRVM